MSLLNKKYTSHLNHYSLMIPSSWTFEEGDECISIYDNADGVGVLQISTYIVPKDTKINIREELKDFVMSRLRDYSEKEFLQKIEGDKNSATIEIIIDNIFWLFLVLFKKNKALFITYNTNSVSKEKEIGIIKSIIETIVFI